MNAADLRELNAFELVEKLDETKAEIFNLRFQVAVSQSDNTGLLGVLKRDVARINTVIRQQELAAWAAQSTEAAFEPEVEELIPVETQPETQPEATESEAPAPDSGADEAAAEVEKPKRKRAKSKKLKDEKAKDMKAKDMKAKDKKESGNG